MNIITHIQFGNDSVGFFTNEFPVTELHTHFNRQYNAFHPSSKAICSSLDVSIVTPSKDNLFFQDWYISNGVRNGRLRLELMNLDAGGEFNSIRYIRFYDTQCYYLGERYDIKDKSLRIMDLKLKPGSCVIDEVPFNEDPERDASDVFGNSFSNSFNNPINNPFNGHRFE